MWPREVKGGIHVTTLELKLEFLHLILIFFSHCTMLPIPRNSFSHLLSCPFRCTISERQYSDGHQWWTSVDGPQQHCTHHKRVCFYWQLSQSSHINAVPTAIVFDKWLCWQHRIAWNKVLHMDSQQGVPFVVACLTPSHS